MLADAESSRRRFEWAKCAQARFASGAGIVASITE